MVCDLGALVMVVELVVSIAVPQSALLAEYLRGVALAAETDELVGFNHKSTSTADCKGSSILTYREELFRLFFIQKR